MKLKKIRSANLIILIFLLLLPHNSYSETAKTKNIFDIQNGKIVVTSISCEVDMKDPSASFASFTGDVTVTINDMNLTCQKLKLFFNNSLKDTSDENSKAYVDKIIATGSVVINVPDKRKATAEKAEYHYRAEKIILTGNPVVRQGDRILANGGIEIILYINEDRLEMKGTKDNKVRLIVTDKEKGI